MRETRLLGPDNNEVVARQTRQNTKAIENAVAGRDGEQGKSAYQVALDNGFSGSEASWLLSLQGSDGQDGSPGVGLPGLQGPRGPAALLGTVTSYDSTNKTATVDIAGSAFLDLPNYSGFVLAANDPVVLVELISGTLVVVGVRGDASGGGGGGGGTLVPSFPIDPADAYSLPGNVSGLASFAFGNLSAISLYTNSLVVFYTLPSPRVFVLNLDNQGDKTDLGNPGSLLSLDGSGLAVINGKILFGAGRLFDGTWKSWYPYSLSNGAANSFYDRTTDCMYVWTRSGSTLTYRVWILSSGGAQEVVTGTSTWITARFGDGHILYNIGANGTAQNTTLIEVSSGGTFSSVTVGSRAINSAWGVDAEGREWGSANAYPNTPSPPNYSLYMRNQANSLATYWNVLSETDPESGNYNRLAGTSQFLDAGDFLITHAVLGNLPFTVTSTSFTPYIWSFDKTGLLTKTWADATQSSLSDQINPFGLRWTDAAKTSFEFGALDKIYRISLS